MLSQRIYLLRDLNVRILVFVHLADLEEDFLVALSECQEFSRVNVSYNELGEQMEEFFGEVVIFLLLFTGRKT